MGFFDWIFKKKKINNKNGIKTEADCKTAEQKNESKAQPSNAVPKKELAPKPAKKTTDHTTAKKPADNTAPKKTTNNTIAKKAQASKTKNKAEEKKSVNTPVAEEIVQISKPSRCGKFEIKKTKDGRFVFNLYASNSVIVATSQTYSSSTAAMNGIKSTIANAAKAPIEDQTLKNVTNLPYPKWEIYLDKSERYRFRLNASNGSTVCHSQGYTSKTNCKNGIESIRKFATDAEIVKSYLDKK